MSDSDETNSRRAARPSTPPFRGPAGPGPRPPLSPPAGGSGSPGTAGKGPAKPVTPALGNPPTGAGRGRPATPVQGARRRGVTPAQGAPGTAGPTPPAGTRVPSMAPREGPAADPAAAIPSYGSAAPPSVAATLKSISEFTIVEDVEEGAGSKSAGGKAAYEPPTASARAGSLRGEDVDSLGGEVSAEEAAWAPGPSDEASDSAEAALFDTSADTGASSGDADPTERASEADRLFDTPALGSPSALHNRAEAEANDDVIAAAFGGTAPVVEQPAEIDQQTAEAPTFIGGDPSTRFVAESLEEIARGIRAGEIRLPPLDPAAEPAAVLAAVLATILAPRR